VRRTFILLLVSPYFVHVVWQKLWQFVFFKFSKVIRQNIVSFLEVVCDNVVSNDVTITSSLRSGVIILRINFRTMFLVKRVLVMVHAKNYETVTTFVKVMQKKPWPLFFRTWCSCHVNWTVSFNAKAVCILGLKCIHVLWRRKKLTMKTTGFLTTKIEILWMTARSSTK